MDLANQVTDNPNPRELDMLLTAGERISMALLALAIDSAGAQSRSFTGSQAGIVTDSKHGNARIAEVTPDRIREALNDGDIAIVAGFQGFNRETKDITTLGRGGSDTTAVALAAALNADVCEIYSDVDGVYTAENMEVATYLGFGAGFAVVVSVIPCQVQHGKALAELFINITIDSHSHI
jgi:aspartate kinase